MLRVLIVEDNHVYRREFKESLCRHFPFMAIEEAVNAEEALQIINTNPPPLVFVDLRLPGMNGLQLTQKIKKDFPSVRIAIVTGYDTPEYRQAAAQFGAEAFFVKESLKWDEVKALVESIEKTMS
jgi:DNA-binding NarL/FixJ family response regulator